MNLVFKRVNKKGNLFTDFSFIYDFLKTPTFGMLMKRQDCKTTLWDTFLDHW